MPVTVEAGAEYDLWLMTYVWPMTYVPGATKYECYSGYRLYIFTDVFGTLSNICDGIFLWNFL